VFNIEFAKPLDQVPRDLVVELHKRLREIGSTLETMPAESEMWPSLAGSVVLLDVEGWRFRYRVDMKGRSLVVDSAIFFGRKKDVAGTGRSAPVGSPASVRSIWPHRPIRSPLCGARAQWRALRGDADVRKLRSGRRAQPY